MIYDLTFFFKLSNTSYVVVVGTQELLYDIFLRLVSDLFVFKNSLEVKREPHFFSWVW